MSSRRRKLLTLGVLLVVVAAAAVFGLWRFLGDAPEEVSLADAVEVAEQAQEPAPSGPASTASTIDDRNGTNAGAAQTSGDAEPRDQAVQTTADLDGIWTVDTETGEFTLSEATGSFAGFRVDEELANIGAFTAVGRTGDVNGRLEIADGHVTAVEIAVDLTTLQTDDRRRDGAIQRALHTSQHPSATFTLTEELHIEGAVEDSAAVSLAAVGDLTVNGITQPVVVDIEAQLVGSLIAVVGSVEIAFADFDVTVPQVPIVLSAEDHGIMEFLLLFEHSAAS